MVESCGAFHMNFKMLLLSPSALLLDDDRSRGIDDITLHFDNDSNDGTTTSGSGHTQKYHKKLSMQRSFIELDSQCGIFLRIRFEPTTNGKLDLQFSKFIIEAKYDLLTVAKGVRMYDWSTGSYMWVRQPYDGLIRVESSIVGSSSSTSSTAAAVSTTTTETESAIDETSESTAAAATSSSSTAVPGTTTTALVTTDTTTTTTTCYHKEEGIKWGCSNPHRIECAPMSAKPPTSQITGYPATTIVLECTSWKDVGCCQDGVGGYYAIDYCAGFGSGSCCAEGEADTNVGCVALIAAATTTTATTSNSQSTGATVSPPSSSSTTTVFELATSTTTVPSLTTTMPSSEEETTTTTTKPTPLPTAPPMSSSLCNNSVTYALGLLVSSIFTLVLHF